MKRFRGFWSDRSQDGAGKRPPPAEPPAPDRRTYAVGDIHGCLSQLEELLCLIADDAAGETHDVVFLGDYIDRGPDSRGVLERLIALEAETKVDVEADATSRVTCLLGNHDRYMRRFLEDPEAGQRWLGLGGQETLASFGVAMGRGETALERLADQAAALREAMPEGMQRWLEARPLWWRSGTLVAVHALTDPDMPMEEQDEEVLIWARPNRTTRPRDDGTWVVHGHTIVPEPRIANGHIAIDTGAFLGEPLTAAIFEPGIEPRFLQTLP